MQIGAVESLSRSELLAVLDEYETLICRFPAPMHRLLAQLQAGSTPQEMGEKSWNAVLRIRWRLSTADAGRRLADAADLGPRRTLTGEPLPPVLAAVAAAQACGLINADHVKVLRDAVDRLPGFVDTTTRTQFEVDLVRVATGVGPKELKETAELRLFLLDQDGPEPDDDEPCTSGTPTQTQIDNDHRTLAQRQHDAIVAVGRIALMSGDLGQLNGLPVSVIIRTTLQDLESRAGIAVSGGGTKLTIKDVLRMASHANHHLAVFDKATGSALNHFRSRRVATPAQRIMLIARDGGCTKPCCTVGAYGCQVHHAVANWVHGGNTNVDEMALACPPDHRLLDQGGGDSTTINGRGEVEWHPPAGLDNHQQRINFWHRPELLLRPFADEPQPDQDAESESDDAVPFDPGRPTGTDHTDGGSGVRGP